GRSGAGRRDYRGRSDGWTAVLMECRPEDADFERHLAYTRFFAQHTVPVPALLTVDNADKRALFEDLGDTSLYSYLKLPRDHESVESMYRDVLRSLVTLHTTATAHVKDRKSVV